jgi:DNA-binding NtrC family response regulator
MAVYGPSIVEIALPEVSERGLRHIARAIIEGRGDEGPALVAGGALYPDAATSPGALVEAARGALHRCTADAPLLMAGRTPDGAGAPVVVSPALKKVFDSARKLADVDIPVLILGETGTGKEVVARAIHAAGPRAGRPLHSINCAAIPEGLAESQLFGHERGAFTGADRTTDGAFQRAHGGTLLLDEISELSAATQAVLLRALETRRICRVGGTQEQEVDVRLLAASNRDLEAMCEAGRFRWDLLYRINTMTLSVPPLRDRREEVEPLARAFLEQASDTQGLEARELSAEAIACLRGWHWPGNVRELRNVVLRAAALAEGPQITAEDLPERYRTPNSVRLPEPAGAEDDDPNLDFKERVRRFEMRLIIAALRQTGGNQTEAARRLNIPLRTLAYKLRSYDIHE